VNKRVREGGREGDMEAVSDMWRATWLFHSPHHRNGVPKVVFIE
jgi:hypothetical protein